MKLKVSKYRKLKYRHYRQTENLSKERRKYIVKAKNKERNNT